MPGGLEETYLHITECGKFAYTVNWTSKGRGDQRNGAAAVAVSMGPGFRLIPCFVENGEVCMHASCVHVLTYVLHTCVIYIEACEGVCVYVCVYMKDMATSAMVLLLWL